MNLEELDLGPRWHAQLVDNRRLTPEGAAEDVHELTLELMQAGFSFRIGQSVAILVAGPHDFGQNHHVRLYTIASTPAEKGPRRISLCVRRCHYLDPYSGERYPGIASNYLCDLEVGSPLLVAGPVGLPFRVPDDASAALLMVGLGTGIAPFRALIRHLYEELGGWEGEVRLFFGARVGLEVAYRDLVSSYQAQSASFQAIEVLSPRPAWDAPIDLEGAIENRRAEIWSLLEAPDTHVYLAGLASIAERFDASLARLAGSAGAWQQSKARMRGEGRWMEVLY